MQLKRRYDLIANRVETALGYLKHALKFIHKRASLPPSASPRQVADQATAVLLVQILNHTMM